MSESEINTSASHSKESLWDLLQLSEHDERHRLMADVLAITLAWQIRAMRKERGWTQQEVAERMGTAAAQISHLEQPEYVLHVSVTTLTRLAKVFDVALIIRFETWKNWMLKMLGETAFAPPPYDHEAVAALAQQQES